MADRTPLKVGLKYLIPVLAMGLVILASNELVQHPVQAIVWSVNLSGILTWGAFTYPIAFLVTDTTNRVFGVSPARKVVYVGFVFGVALTLGAALALARSTRSEGMSLLAALLHDDEAFAMFRIALASGSAFLVAQLLDIQVFDWLRRGDWWKAPVASSFIGSLVDTVIFFFLAFAGTGLPWASWAMGDFGAKLLMIALLLYPFKALVSLYPNSLRGLG